jgi:3-oxoacyl-[acyl-carrier protein] reductase
MNFAVESFGSLNVVVPCAGIIRDSLLVVTDKSTGRVKAKMDFATWKSVIDTNLTGTFLCVRDAAEAMINSASKGVIFVISSVNRIGQIGQLNYSSSKTAGSLFPKIIVGEFNRKGIRGIRVVGIAPGYVGTPMVRAMKRQYLEEVILPDVHIGRLIEPEEVAHLILHVCQNEAIDATTLEITGGLCHTGGIAK